MRSAMHTYSLGKFRLRTDRSGSEKVKRAAMTGPLM